MNNPIIEDNPLTFSIRSCRGALRVFAYVVSFLMLNALVAQDLYAVQDGLQKEARERQIVLTGSPEQKMSQALQKLQEEAAEKDATVMTRISDESGFMDSVLSFFGMSNIQMENTDQLKALSKLLSEQHSETLRSFKEEEKQLKKAKLPAEILQRHYDAVAVYESTYDEMSAHLEDVLKAKNLRTQGDALESLNALMLKQKLKKTHQTVDPNNLPWGSPDAKKTRKPVETPEELSQITGIPNHPQATMLAANIITPEMLGKLGGPVAEDLVSTIDAQLSDAIRAKAAELSDDPVKIYDWVRNNVEFIPSYGSIQGADYTLQSGKGNAFDTASLLVAMLRAANVPARYAYGTVQIPVDKVMNWVGGVNNAQAAQQLLGQGGIPNVAMVSGGKVTHIKMEHVWVEAWVDYFPSRGAKHKAGDSWIPLDASFKQYEFIQGEGFDAIVDFDEQELASQLVQGAVFSQELEFLQNVPQSPVSTALADYKSQISSYLASQPEVNLDQIIGDRKLIVKEHRELAAGLPYQLLARTHNYSEIPTALRHKFRYTLGMEQYGQESSRLLTFERFLPEIAGKQLGLYFRPATDADAQVIANYIPAPDPDTGLVDTNELPRSLPGHLINVAAKLVVNGSVVQTVDSAGRIGTELFETLGLYSPSSGWNESANHIIAGEHQSIGLSMHGETERDFDAPKSRLEALEDLLDDEGTVDSISSMHLIGDLMGATISGYLALNAVQDQLQASSNNVVVYRMPSYGKFSTSLQPSYFFGVPRSVSFSGFVMDVDRLATQIVDRNNDQRSSSIFMQAAGVRSSAMEHLFPELIFSTDDSPARGTSAIKALADAGAEGQKIWIITSNNLTQALSAISLSAEIKTEIRNAVLSGKVVTTHERPIVGNNVGYIIVDPETGAGAYKISGGANGGLLDMADKGLEAAINFLSMIEDAVGDAKYLFKPLKKLVGQVKSTLENLQRLLDILRTCGAIGAFAGILVLGFMMFAFAKVLAVASGLIGLGCSVTGPAAPYCAFAAGYVLLPYLLEFTNFMMDDTFEYISSGWLCKLGT